MAIKNMIAGGIGFSPGSVKFIPTRGLIAGEAVAALFNTGRKRPTDSYSRSGIVSHSRSGVTSHRRRN